MKHVLLLEDDAGVSAVLVGVLEEEKYYVSTTMLARRSRPGSPTTTTPALILPWITGHPRRSPFTSTQPALALRYSTAPRSDRFLDPSWKAY